MTARVRVAVLIGIALAAFLVVLIARGQPSPPTGGDQSFRLRVESEDGEYQESVFGLKGESIVLDDPYVGSLTIRIEKIDGAKVTISTSTPMAPEGATGGINLNDLRTEFILVREKPVRFSTPTTDAGRTYIASMESIDFE